MSNLPDVGERFKDNLISMIMDLEDMIKEAVEQKIIKKEIKLLVLVKEFIACSDGVEIIKVFIKRTREHWNAIKEKDEDHIEEILKKTFSLVHGGDLSELKNDEDIGKAAGLISKITGSHAETIKTVLSAEYESDGKKVAIFDESRKEDLWQILRGFVGISLCHIYETRKDNVQYYPDIKVKAMVEEWGLKLPLR